MTKLSEEMNALSGYASLCSSPTREARRPSTFRNRVRQATHGGEHRILFFTSGGGSYPTMKPPRCLGPRITPTTATTCPMCAACKPYTLDEEVRADHLVKE